MTATLSVADPSSTATGHLVNGTFSLPQALQVGLSAAGTARPSRPSAAPPAPTTVMTYGGPTSNEVTTLTSSSRSGQRRAAHRGVQKTLTFTLSTTNP